MNLDWESNPPNSRDEAIRVAKALRCAADEGERRFMRFLRWLEPRELWKDTAEVTFDSFLEAEHICRARRYRDACKALEIFGDKTVEQVGLDGSIVATLVPAGKQQEAIAKLRAIRETNGVPSSRENAHNVLSNAHLLPAVEKSKAQRQMGRVAELERANKELRTRLANAEARAEEAEARAERYEAQLRAVGIKPKSPPKSKKRAA